MGLFELSLEPVVIAGTNLQGNILGCNFRIYIFPIGILVITLLVKKDSALGQLVGDRNVHHVFKHVHFQDTRFCKAIVCADNIDGVHTHHHLHGANLDSFVIFFLGAVVVGDTDFHTAVDSVQHLVHVQVLNLVVAPGAIIHNQVLVRGDGFGSEIVGVGGLHGGNQFVHQLTIFHIAGRFSRHVLLDFFKLLYGFLIEGNLLVHLNLERGLAQAILAFTEPAVFAPQVFQIAECRARAAPDMGRNFFYGPVFFKQGFHVVDFFVSFSSHIDLFV